MELLLIPRPGDRERLLGHITHMKTFSLTELVDAYNASQHTYDEIKIKTDFYSNMFKNYCWNHIGYGRKTLDFQDGSLVCIAPNRVITIDNDIDVKEDTMGWGLFFHPDLIQGTALGVKMKDYSFFSYQISEA
jgi:hypothetical protein